MEEFHQELQLLFQVGFYKMYNMNNIKLWTINSLGIGMTLADFNHYATTVAILLGMIASVYSIMANRHSMKNKNK